MQLNNELISAIKSENLRKVKEIIEQDCKRVEKYIFSNQSV
jgi:hypothetical protein